MTAAHIAAVQITNAYNALFSLVAALKGPEYLGVESRKRLVAQAAVVRRGLEAAEQIIEAEVRS